MCLNDNHEGMLDIAWLNSYFAKYPKLSPQSP